MKGSHRVVVPALIVVTATGILMTAADWSTFEGSRLFWSKMIGFGLLVINGILLVAAERRYAHHPHAPLWWRRVVIASGTSCLLWLLILWIGEWLTIAA